MDLAADLDPAAVEQAHVEDGDVGFGSPDARHHVVDRRRLPTTALSSAAWRSTQTCGHDLVIVEEEHIRRRGVVFPISPAPTATPDRP